MRYTVYKVLNYDTTHQLIGAGMVPKKFKCRYKLKQKNYGSKLLPKSKVFVFRNILDAKRFQRTNGGMIFKGKCRSFKEMNILPSIWYYDCDRSNEKTEHQYLLNNLKSFWLKKSKDFKLSIGSSSHGTCCASYIYLQERVELY